MPGNAPPVRSEREALLAYLTQQRDGLIFAAFGLTNDQIRLKPSASALSVGGLIRHGTLTERSWIQTLQGRSGMSGEQDYLDTFSLTDDETLESLVEQFHEVAAETEAAVNGLDDLGVAVQLPSAPWFPSDPQGYSARWILLHIIEELARHAGHADIVREHIDGATMYELMAAAEGWPETDWLKPWKPSASPHSSGSAH